MHLAFSVLSILQRLVHIANMASCTSHRHSILLVCMFVTHVISGMLIRSESRDQHPEDWSTTELNKRSVGSLIEAAQSAPDVCLNDSAFRTMMQELVDAEIKRLQNCMSEQNNVRKILNRL